ncbi:nuclear pore complex protein Nup85-like [Pollicipes pollicipes]|uniref:nuclear pore complex protein Nup85-like n=1 Tax=Pollicipes pollicipes TaxID=41117 RepID=UPI0018853098|nr:nuclear pore complex protein Nup85-like [Pollicipes pollicipes]XP_037081200.1 nuclear pore complex protein Nup85-like [Pollicipes pollicipes]
METVSATDAADAEMQRQLLDSMEMIWHLCEILLIEKKRGGVVLYQLLDWVRQHATQFDRAAAHVTEAEVPESHPEYWNTVYGFVLQGRQDAARKLLRLHGSFGTEPFVSADELLRKTPAGGEASVAGFELRWRGWQEQCIRRLEDGEFGFSPRLQTLVKILCGDAPTFEDLYKQMGSWYHLMVSYTLYSRPWVGISDLRDAAEDSIEVFGGARQHSALDAMLHAVVDGDVHTLLKTAQATLPDGWLTAHLADLLHRLPYGGGGGRRTSFLTELRHHLVLEYGGALFAARPLWQLGAVYLDGCGPQGRARLALLLERLDPDSDRRARKIIEVAERRGLTEVASSVAQVMGRRALRAGQLGTALAWALRSDSTALASRLADTLVREYSGTGQFASADFIDNLGACILKSDRLMFLGKYREFHRLYEEGKMADAASLLVTLLTSQLAPKYFWMTLLLDAVPLLKGEEVVISSAQTYDLIGCVEQLRRAEKLDEDSADVKLIRLALSHNLAQAIIVEGSSAG